MSEIEVKSSREKGRMSPGFLLLSSWIIISLLVMLFGYDVNMWAFSSDNTFVQEKVVPLTGKLSKFANESGLRGIRQDVEAKVHPIYDDSPLWAEIEEPGD